MDLFLCTGATGLPGGIGPKGHSGIIFILTKTRSNK